MCNVSLNYFDFYSSLNIFYCYLDHWFDYQIFKFHKDYKILFYLTKIFLEMTCYFYLFLVIFILGLSSNKSSLLRFCLFYVNLAKPFDNRYSNWKFYFRSQWLTIILADIIYLAICFKIFSNWYYFTPKLNRPNLSNHALEFAIDNSFFWLVQE